MAPCSRFRGAVGAKAFSGGALPHPADQHVRGNPELIVQPPDHADRERSLFRFSTSTTRAPAEHRLEVAARKPCCSMRNLFASIATRTTPPSKAHSQRDTASPFASLGTVSNDRRSSPQCRLGGASGRAARYSPSSIRHGARVRSLRASVDAAASTQRTKSLRSGPLRGGREPRGG
jgi:hypothetical protein